LLASAECSYGEARIVQSNRNGASGACGIAGVYLGWIKDQNQYTSTDYIAPNLP
jgi:hypothetical protein